ncbi:MAG: biotin--[acetyl-CoA-carboxylase] ligase [Candidatus Eremiobacterota bacterium]
MDSLSRICNNKLSAKHFAKSLNTHFTGKDIIFLPEVTSTNLFAKEHVKNLKNGTVIVADSQTLGRGRMNKKWFSPKGLGLWTTIILKNPAIETQKLPLINALISVVITKSILNISGKQVAIKWPNDLLLDGKKICGILTELLTVSGETILICGFGINTGKNISFPSDIMAYSIELEGERAFLLKEILEQFEYFYNLLPGEEILKEWRKHSISLNRYIETGEKIPARVLDIGPRGELLVEIDGTEKAIYSGDNITWK